MRAKFKSHLFTAFTAGAMLLFAFSACKKDDDTPVDNTRKVTVTLSGAQEVPAITTSGTGSAKLTFDPALKTLTYNMTWTLGSASATTANMHFHGAEDGSDTKSSAVVIGITGFATTSTGTVSGVTRVLTDVEIAQLLAGKWYINIHSSTVASGELRGNIKF
ncbi:MAG: CHRD domain-containing protein [Daejeonella sp.]